MMFVVGGLFVLLVGQAAVVEAKTRYVSDQLIITFREGKGNQYRVIRTLKTGTPVEVLEEDNDYAKVRLESGDEGYVLKQYLTPEKPKDLTIAAQQKEIAGLKKQLASIDSNQDETGRQLAESRELQDRLAAQLDATTAQLEQLQIRYDDLQSKSSDVISLSQDRDKLQAEAERMGAELKELREENRTLFRTAMIQWFVAGGGVFFVGWITGKVSRRKRRGGFS